MPPEVQRKPLITRLIAPRASISGAASRKRAAEVAACLLTTVIAVFLIIVLMWIAGYPDLFSLIGLGVLVVCYGISRTANYTTGGILALITAWVTPLISSMIDLPQFRSSLLMTLTWVIVGMCLGILLWNDRRDVESALREREERYRVLTQYMSDYAYSLQITEDGRWVIEWVDGAWTSITGQSIESIATVRWREVVHPDDLSILLDRDTRLLRGERGIHEYRIRTPDGGLRWIRDYGYPIWNKAHTRVERIYGGVQEITKRREAEAAAEEQRRLADALRETASIISNTLEQDEVLDRILEQVFRVIPSDSADIMLIEAGKARIVRARGYAGRVGGEGLLKLEININEVPNFRRMFMTGESIVVTDVDNSPEWRMREISAWIRSYVGTPIILDGITMGFINVTSDLPNTFTQTHAAHLRAFASQAAIAIRNALLFDEVRRYADALSMMVVERTNELSLERERLRAILEASGEGIVYWEQGVIKYVNPAFAGMMGYKQQELIGQPLIMLRDPRLSEKRAARLLMRVDRLVKRRIWRGEIPMRRKDGSILMAGITLSRVAGTDGADPLVRVVTIVRDITREKALQQQQSQFVAHASHELRTPITNFKTRLHLLRRDPANMEKHISIMEEVSERMRRLVNDLLDLSRFERGLIPLYLNEVDLTHLVTRVFNAQQEEANRKQIILTLSPADMPLTARVDEERMIQVVTNLVTNAIHYTPSGGVIVVSVKPLPDGRHAEIVVRDTGIGIAPEHLPLIFQPFFRVSNEVEGSGLGLSIAKQLVEQHGGAITVESKAGEGSVFTITLRLARAIGERPQLNSS